MRRTTPDVARSDKRANTLLLTGNLILIGGLVGAAALVLSGVATTVISRFIYLRIDLPAFCIAAAITALSIALFFAPPMTPTSYESAKQRLSAVEPWYVALVALIVIVVAVGPVYHDFDLSMDEYMTRLQAEIFAAGRLAGEAPDEWRQFGRALHHRFARFDTESGLVYSTYRPGMAALYALFDLVGLGLYTSAILSAGSVLLVASIARKLWPNSTSAPLVAAALLGTSQQVLVTGLTSYAMAAHLFLNLLWLRLFLIDRFWAHGLAALIGVATAALHQVHLHAFFAAPFLLTLFRPFRLRELLLYGTTYLVGHALIIGWDQFAAGSLASAVSHTDAIGTGAKFYDRITSTFRLPGLFEFSSVSALIVRFFAWQNLMLVPLIYIAVRRVRWSTPLRLLAAGIALSTVPYILLMPDQGHGWGYRYLHGLIGNFVLIATAGWIAIEAMADADRRRVFPPLLVAGLLSVVVMVPMRAIQVERMVAPFALGYEYIRSINADVVIVDTPAIYYGQDLVRNGPFIENRPVIIDLRHMNAAQVEQLCATYSVALAGADDLIRFGLLELSSPNAPPPDRQRILELLSHPQCRRR